MDERLAWSGPWTGRAPEYSSIREELYLHVHVATGLVQAGYRVPVDELLPWVASTYYPSTRSTTTHYGRAPSMACPVGRPGTRVLEKSSTYRCTISRYKIGTGRVLAHSCCVYTAVHSTEKLYSTGTLPIYLYMRAITHRPRSLGWE